MARRRSSAGSSSPSTGPGRRARAASGPRRPPSVGYRFCDTGLLYRAVTWLAEHRGVEVDDPVALSALVDEVELAPDERGPAVAGPRRRRRPHRRRARPGGRLGRLDGLGRARSSGPRCWRASGTWRRPAGSSWPAATSGPSSCPTPTSRSSSTRRSRSGPRRRTEERGLDPDGPEAERDPRRPAPPRRARPEPPGRAAPARRRTRASSSTDGNRFEDTVDAVTNAIRDAEARR